MSQVSPSKAGPSLERSSVGQQPFTLSLGTSGATIHGIPTPAQKPGPTQTTTTVRILGSHSQVAVPANGTIPYGELLTVVAEVDEIPGNKPVTSGMVDFTENGASVKPEFSNSAICQAVPVVKGTASCAITALAANSTPYQFGASYTPAQGSLIASKVASAQGPAVTVVKATTTLTLSGGPDTSSPGNVRLQAVVANRSAGSSLAPTGTVSFEQGGVGLICEQGQPVLSEATSSSSSVFCNVPAPSGTTTYTALYIPANSSDFAASGPVSTSVAPGTGSATAGGSGASSPEAAPAGSFGPSILAGTSTTATSCSSIFSTLWSDGLSGPTTLTFSPGSSALTFLANLSLTEAQTSGQCSPSTSIAFSQASLSLAGSTLSGTGLGGTITDVASTSSSPQLCITSGNLGGEAVTVSGSLCFSISTASASGGTVDNVSSASLSQVGSVSIIPSVLTLSGVSVNISNGTPPSTCTLSSSGDWWLSVSGNLALTLSQQNVSASGTATGCIDLSTGTSGTFELTSDLGSISLGSTVSLQSFDVILKYSSGSGFAAQGTALVTINMPSGGQLSTSLTVAFDSSGALVVGGQADLSSFLPSSLGGTASAYLYYATAAYPSFNTGVSAIGTIDLVPGLNLAFSTSLPASFVTSMQNTVHIDIPQKILAVGSFDTSTDTFKLAITLTFSSPVQLFDNQGVALDLNSASVTLSVSPVQVSISFSMKGTLYPDGTSGQQVAVSGTLSAVVGSSPSVSISVSVNESTLGKCGSGKGWSNAFSDTGLTVKCAELTVGVTDVFPFVKGSINGVITQLPTDMANAIGYQQNAPIAFAFGFNPYYLDLSIGTYGSTTPALEPLASFDNGSYATDLQVTYAQLCFMQPGATPVSLGGGLTCRPGYVLGFSATIDVSVFKNPVTVNVLSSMSIGNPTSFDFSANISQITVGSDLNVGPVTLVVCASTAQTCDNNTSYFQFEFDGSFSLSGSAIVPKFVELSGSLSMSLNVKLSTSGFTALVSGSGSGSITSWNAFANCSGKWYNPLTWYCAGGWGSTTSVSFTLGSTGISANSTGVTLSVDGTNITFPFSSASQSVVPPPTTSTTLSSSVNGSSSTTSTYGQPVVLTATVSASGATFDGGGSVSFYLDSTNGQFAIPGCSGANAVALQDNSGSYTATCTTSTNVVPSSGDTMILPAGSDSVVAQYSGNSNFPVSTSSAVTETVNAATPTLAISATPSPDYYGQSLTLSVKVSPTDGGGTVTFKDNGTSITGCSSLKLAGNAGLGLGTDDTAQASCSVGNSWNAGTHSITVSYSGDVSALKAQSSADVVVKKDNTTTSVSVSPTQATYGNESASVFTVNVTTAHGESLPTTDKVTVHVGSASCTASVAPSTGGGTGSCSIGDTALGASSTAYVVTATYPGDADLNASAQATATTGLTVNKDNTVTTVSASPSSAPYASETAVIFRVTVAPHYGETGPSNESVTIKVGSTSCHATLTDGVGSCSITPAVLPVGGPYLVSVTYPGDSNFFSSSGTNSFSVVTSSMPDCSNYAGANLAGADLAGADLAGCNLAGADLKYADLEGANLAGANLQGTNLKGAILQGDNLVGADLQGANLMGDNVEYANLQGVDMKQANLQGANLYLTYDFSGANLEGVNFQYANLAYANLEYANLTNVNFHHANLEYANLTNAVISGTQFRGAILTGVIT